MLNGQKLLRIFLILLLVLGTASALAQDVSGDLEIFSWWTGSGEEAGLLALITRFNALFPNVNVINSAVAGGAGTNAKVVLRTRMQRDMPPGTFQVHAGAELNADWVAAGKMESLNFLYEEKDWLKAYPEALIKFISDSEGQIYAVPVNIHRANVMWYVPANLQNWGVSVPATWAEFLGSACPVLQARGIVPLALGEAWTQSHLWESVALAQLGVETYNGLWNGTTDWQSDEVIGVFETYGRILDCANEDMAALAWQDASQMVIDGEAAFTIMGDWVVGYYLELGLEPKSGFSWAASPGTQGVFMMLSDTFGLPKNAPNRDAVLAWLGFLGSAEAQDIFNPLRGSLPANTGADTANRALYNAYFQEAYIDWTTNIIVGSQAHGAVAPPMFTSGFEEIIAQFEETRAAFNAAAASAALARSNGMVSG